MSPLDQRPLVVAIAGPNVAGKSTFVEAHLRRSGMRFVNADELARELGIDAYMVMDVARDGERVVLELASEQRLPLRTSYRTRQDPPRVGEKVHFGRRFELLAGPAPDPHQARER